MGMHGYGSGKNYHAMMGCMARSRRYDAGQESLGKTRSLHTVLQPALTLSSEEGPGPGAVETTCPEQLQGQDGGYAVAVAGAGCSRVQLCPKG